MEISVKQKIERKKSWDEEDKGYSSKEIERERDSDMKKNLVTTKETWQKDKREGRCEEGGK